MDNFKNIKRHYWWILPILIGWLIIVFSASTEVVFFLKMRREPVNVSHVMERSFLIWSIWFLYIPLIIYLVRTVPLLKKQWLLRAILYVIVYTALVSFHIFFDNISYSFFEGDAAFVMSLRETVVRGVQLYAVIDFILFLSIILGFELKKTYEQYRKRELHAVNLKSQLLNAQLSLLRMELHPHFLFNTLHGISSLLDYDPPGARIMLQDLRHLVKRSFESQPNHTITLREEVELTQAYLNIEKRRFSDRLNVVFDIEPAIKNTGVPAFLLQPLVENAVKHGISSRIKPGNIRISAGKCENDLELVVEDDGPGINSEQKKNGNSSHHGMGLEYVMQRLNCQYDRYRFSLGQSDLGGLKVTIRIPWKTEGNVGKTVLEHVDGEN
ncbi:MAG TPA: histidine kinase [Balneolales bacterium]|nr:histidine kinase [Balneolales bacterium]